MFQGWRSALKTSLALEPKKFEDKELEALLEKGQSQTQEELALGVTQQAVFVRLRVMGMIQKQGNCLMN